MKEYPFYLQSLIEELQSCDLANEILTRYECYSEDPLLKPVFQLFSKSRNAFIYSSQALSLICQEKPSGTTPIRSLSVDKSQDSRENPSEFCPFLHEFSGSTLWSEIGVAKAGQKSLKQLSYEVKQIVYQMQNCTYKEVADRIVGNEGIDNEKNLRRRVYDAINVLTSVGVFVKRGKQIYYVQKNEEALKNVEAKKEGLKKVVRKIENLHGLIERNKERPCLRDSIKMPFFLVIGSKNAVIRTEVNDKVLRVLSSKKIRVLKSIQFAHLVDVKGVRVLPKEVYQIIDN